MNTQLTNEELWDLYELADSHADSNDYDEAVYEKYIALADKLRSMLKEG